MSEKNGGGSGKVIGLIVTLCILGAIGALIAYAFKSQIGLDDWNIGWLNGFEDWVQSLIPINAVKGEDFTGVTFFDENGNKCVLGDSTALAIMSKPSRWKEIKLYNSAKATFYVEGDTTRSFVITEHTDEATIKSLVEALVEDGDFNEQEQSLAVEIEDAFEDANGYLRIMVSENSYATVGTSDFLDISRRSNLAHGVCPPGLQCAIYPNSNFNDISFYQDADLSSNSALGAYSYQWVKGSDSVPRPVVGIENYLDPETEYALEYKTDDDPPLDFAGHPISPGNLRGALSEPSSNDEDELKKHTDIIYNSFNMVSAATIFDEGDFYCRYGKKIGETGEGAFTETTSWPECFPESESESE